jgi:hypothetical protein
MTVPLVICAIFKNEAKYISEWIIFHQIVGFSKFFLYNNNSTDNYLEVLQPFIDQGIVDLTEWDRDPPCQLQAYQHFINQNNQKPIWTGFFDVDEFCFGPTNMPLPDMLNFIDQPGAIGINWKCFGSSGLEEYDSRSVIERFTYHPLEFYGDKHIKSIIRLDQPVIVGGDPHFFQTTSSTVNENGVFITSATSDPSSNIFRINHYLTKSKNEYIEKRNRGRADIPKEDDKFDWSVFNALNCGVEDLSIQKFLPELKRRLA